MPNEPPPSMRYVAALAATIVLLHAPRWARGRFYLAACRAVDRYFDRRRGEVTS